jgi:hypothetical protein
MDNRDKNVIDPTVSLLGPMIGTPRLLSAVPEEVEALLSEIADEEARLLHLED